MSHTPLPWKLVPVEELTIDGLRVIETQDETVVALVSYDDDADLVLAACNAHYGLVEALEAMLGHIDFYSDEGPVGSGWKSTELMAQIASARDLLKALEK